MDPTRHPIEAPLPGTVVTIAVAVDEPVRAGQELVIIESMKLEHVVSAAVDGIVRELPVSVGARSWPGRP